MRQFTTDDLRALLQDREAPCLSLYQPTHRHHPDNQQDPIRYKNLLKELEASLRKAYGTRDVRPLLEPFQALTENATFWRHTLDGLALFGAPGEFRVFHLQRPVPELAVAAESYHCKPLIRVVQSADRYQLLAIDRQKASLYEGNRDVLDEVEPAEDEPRSLTEALGEERTEPHRTVASYGGGAGGPAMHHGHGGRKDEVDIDADRFFRAIDRAVLENHSRPSGLPLILAALGEHHDRFRTVSHNPFLLDVAIAKDPGALSIDQLRVESWQVMLPKYLERLAALQDSYREAASKRLGTDDLSDIAQAAVAGRVGTLLVEADRQVPGSYDPATGKITFAQDLANPAVDDLLDDLAERTLKMGGEVVVVPADRMPGRSGAAAIFRF